MDTTNIILHWIAHFSRQGRGQADAKCSRPRPTCRGQSRGQYFGLECGCLIFWNTQYLFYLGGHMRIVRNLTCTVHHSVTSAGSLH